MYTTIKGRSSSNLVTLHQLLAELWPFSYLEFQENDNVRMITQERVNGSKCYFAYMYITIKGRPGSNLVTLHQNLTELWPPFNLEFGQITMSG